MNVVIVGCGRVGARLSLQFVREGADVTIIDQNAAAFARLGNNFAGNALVGNGIDEDMLRRAGIEEADVFVAVTEGDNRNIMACQMAQHIFNVPRVICKINDPVRNEVYMKLGLKTFCPTIVGADTIHAMIEKD